MDGISITVERVASGEHFIGVKFFAPDSLRIVQPFTLKENMHHRFELRKVKDKWKIVPVSESPVVFKNVDMKNDAESMVVTTPIEELPSGNCNSPMDEIQFETFSERLKKILCHSAIKSLQIFLTILQEQF